MDLQLPDLKRTVEPELMDDPVQAAAYAAADFSSSDQALVDQVEACFGADLGDRLLDLGCGPGTITFRLAERFPGASVLGVDGAPAMLALADKERLRRMASSPQLADRVTFAAYRLAADGPGSTPLQGFTAVVSNSLLHHLHDPQVLWGQLRQLAAPGAAIYIKDLRRPATAAAAEALLHLHLGSAPPVLQRDYLASLHAAFRLEEVEAQLVAAGLPLGPGGLQVAEVEDRYLEIVGRL